ncbi:hypothetical protein [EBPR siphovirus 1]|nr:hypothetical protein [EBPR siphovirus 1]
MVDIVTRAGKGAPLTHTEMDANFNNLNSGKQETLVSGDNIKRLNGVSILGPGNIVFGPDYIEFPAGETLLAGEPVGIANGLVVKASAIGVEAVGFVLEGVAQGSTAKLCRDGVNTAVTGLTAGVQYLGTSPGTFSSTPPTTAGALVQKLGLAVDSFTLIFKAERILRLA